MSMIELKQDEKPTLYGLAMLAYKAADGNTLVALNALVEQLQDDDVLLQAVVDDAVRRAATAAIGQVATSRRNKILRAATTPVHSGRAGVISLATGMASSLMDFPLTGGLRLAQATRADLAEAINRYSAQAASHQRNAEWLRLILQSLPDDRPVGEVLNEDRLKELLGEVSK